MKRIAADSNLSSLTLSANDLENFLVPLICGDGISDITIGKPTARGLPVTLHDINVNTFIPDFNLKAFVKATLLNPATIRCEVDVSGLAGWILDALTSVGGLTWVVSLFAEDDSFEVTGDGDLDLHLDRLPADLSEWLTNRLVFASFNIPAETGGAASATFTIKRFMTATVVKPVAIKSLKKRGKARAKPRKSP